MSPTWTSDYTWRSLIAIAGRNVSSYCGLCRGVNNGATGAAAAAPLIWLVVIIQKWRTFRRPTHFYLARSVNVSAGLLGRDHNGLVRNIWESGNRPLIICLLCAMIALMINVFIAASITRLSWCLFDPCCSSTVIDKNLFCVVTGNW